LSDKKDEGMALAGGVGSGRMMASAKGKGPISALWIAGLLLSLVLLAGAFIIWSRPSVSIPAAGMDNGWELVLVNRDNALPLGWEPELIALSNGSLVDVRIYPALQQMFDDMRAQGVYPTVRDGWRSGEVQEQLLKGKVQEFRKQGYTAREARAMAENWVALPGTSEHNLGLAVDIVAKDYQILDEKQARTEEIKWLQENCSQYGFILRYPKGKEDITKVSYESWHFRYVGVDAAKEIMSQGITLEEYLQFQEDR